MSASTVDVTPLIQRYRELYHREPQVVARAPGRIEIIGNHTDHNNGRVVAAAVTQETVVVAGPSTDGSTRLTSLGWNKPFHVPSQSTSLKEMETLHDTERLMAGVAAGLQELGLPAPPFDGVMASTVQPGSGMSSSAALEVALAGAHTALAGGDITPLHAALAGKFAENEGMGKPSGLMDQLASALGGIHMMDFSVPQGANFRRIDLDFATHGYRVVVIHTGGSHADLTDQYAAIPQEMHRLAKELGVQRLVETTEEALISNAHRLRAVLGDRAVQRGLHFFAEQARVDALVNTKGNEESIAAALRTMRESGSSSWRLLQNVFPPGAVEDQPVALALAVAERCLQREATRDWAVRVHGGGFAGTALAVVPEEVLDMFTTSLEQLVGTGAVVPVEISSAGITFHNL